MDTHLDPTSIALLNLLTEKQKDYALTLYANREKKVSTAYILWVVFGVYYFYLGHPVKNILLWILCGCFIGIIWWIIDLFRISGMVKRKNRRSVSRKPSSSTRAPCRPCILKSRSHRKRPPRKQGGLLRSITMSTVV